MSSILYPCPMDTASGNDPRVMMAAERTFLAWVRTGVALMGFGFVVARFGLFLRELAFTQSSLAQPRHALSIPIGVALVILGILVTAVAAVRHHRYIQVLQSGASSVPVHSRLPFIVATLLITVGVAMALYLAFI